MKLTLYYVVIVGFKQICRHLPSDSRMLSNRTADIPVVSEEFDKRPIER